MPRRAVIAVVACIAIAIALWFVLRDRATTKPNAIDTSPSASTTSNTTSANTSGAHANTAAPIPPPEARVDLGAAFTASQFEDVHALCASRETAAAHPFECTVAACKTNHAAEAQRYFVGVADADREKVQAECEAAHVHVDPEADPRRRLRPHLVRGKRVIDD